MLFSFMKGDYSMKSKKLLSTLLIAGVIASTGTCAFAAVPIDNTQSVLHVQEQVAPATIKTVSGTNSDYWSEYNAKITFTASADVIYDNSLGRYTMSNVYASRPSVSLRNGATATITTPTITMIDGGRNAKLTSTATIQNASGGSSTVTVSMVVYCDSNCNLSMKSY